MSKNVESTKSWLYYDYKYIGEKIDDKIFQVGSILVFKKMVCSHNCIFI